MEKKKMICMGIFLFVLGISLGYLTYHFVNKKEKNKEEPNYKQEVNEVERTKYYINFFDNTIPGKTYILEMDKTGKYTLEVYHASSALDVEPTTDKYNDTLTSEQLSKVNEIFEYIKDKNELEFEESYVFYYDYNNLKKDLSFEDFSTMESTLSAINSISKKDEMIGEETYLEFGNELLEYIVSEIREELSEEKDGYLKINFLNSSYLPNDKIKLSKEKEILYSNNNNKISFDNSMTELKTTQKEIYAVDINKDGTSEIITRTMDERVSPATNEYHIYQYKNDTYKEIATIEIIGTIDSFYIKGDDIKVKYIPYEAAPGYNTEEHFKVKYE